uniref:Uncharacterized protein n=1 Tax=Arundo donax TaxID=35708 RepID=A0A0A9F5C3_ARUDO
MTKYSKSYNQQFLPGKSIGATYCHHKLKKDIISLPVQPLNQTPLSFYFHSSSVRSVHVNLILTETPATRHFWGSSGHADS